MVILGSTGSIGTQALDVIARNPGRFRVVGLSAGGGSVEALTEQVRRFAPRHVAVADADAAASVRAATGADVWEGPDASTRLAAVVCDVVLNGITGAAGLEPTLAALAAGRTVAAGCSSSKPMLNEVSTNTTTRDGRVTSRWVRFSRSKK